MEKHQNNILVLKSNEYYFLINPLLPTTLTEWNTINALCNQPQNTPRNNILGLVPGRILIWGGGAWNSNFQVGHHDEIHPPVALEGTDATSHKTPPETLFQYPFWAEHQYCGEEKPGTAISD